MSILVATMLATSLLGSGTEVGPVWLADNDPQSLVSNPGKRPKKLGFGGSFTLGYLATHSATTTSSFNAELELGYNTPLWQNRLDLQAVSASTDGTTTAEQYFGAFQSNRLLSQRSYVFGYLGYLHDRFSGYIYQASEVAGYGVRVVDTKTQTLKLELGAGFTQAKQSLGANERSVAARGRESYEWQFSDHGSVSQSLTAEKSNFNLYSQFQTKVTAQLIGKLALVLAYTIQHNSSVISGSPQTTSMTSISVQYTFGSIFGQS